MISGHEHTHGVQPPEGSIWDPGAVPGLRQVLGSRPGRESARRSAGSDGSDRAHR